MCTLCIFTVKNSNTIRTSKVTLIENDILIYCCLFDFTENLRRRGKEVKVKIGVIRRGCGDKSRILFSA